MASIFTFEPEPIKLASPWPNLTPSLAEASRESATLVVVGIELPPAISLSECGITKLEAEPQDGPIEYKLHLLLRPRREYISTSTVQNISGSHLSKSRTPNTLEDSGKESIAPPLVLAPGSHSRQNRLQHLTTQLLWRLQQSSPYHSSAKSNLVLPILPELNEHLDEGASPGNTIPGLVESLGALYEIGVSDDGSFVGLTLDELQESLIVLRAMASSLGCGMSILRLVTVGHCRWEDECATSADCAPRPREEKLLVAEVLVAPCARLHGPELVCSTETGPSIQPSPITVVCHQSDHRKPLNEQLRISLTGGTTSGKSSLLGTLSTSTLDNGRGKSRLSLLKHRHEIVSGVTSSLAQELIGYCDFGRGSDVSADQTSVVNYETGNVSSWTDIHHAADSGNLVFVTDSAGHPRYRRTTIRGLVSWAPHWTLCCVAAREFEDDTTEIGANMPVRGTSGSASQDFDLSKEHLELCLKLDLPLVVVITKLDLASRSGLRQTLAGILSTLKLWGRKPSVISASKSEESHSQLQSITQTEMEAVTKAIGSVSREELHLLVPIVLTSAVTGSGMGRVHALLRRLPVLPVRSSSTDGLAFAHPAALFHVDEVITVAKAQKSSQEQGLRSVPQLILSGYLRRGLLKVGDKLFLGPFSAVTENQLPENSDVHSASSYHNSISGSPGALVNVPNLHHVFSSESDPAVRDIAEHSKKIQSWQHVQIVSLRNLRLPVNELKADQVGTVAISSLDEPFFATSPCLRRGMVLMASPGGENLSGFSRFAALFNEPNAYVIPGSSVTVYIASIRTTAKILEVRIPDTVNSMESSVSLDETVTHEGGTSEGTSLKQIEITFQFTTGKEWIEVGTRVFVTPASGLSILIPPERGIPGIAGLDGFVGTIVGAST